MSSPLTTRTRVGLVLAVVLGLADVVSAFFPTPDGEVGPPLAIVILGGVIGLATLAAVAVAWRSGRRGALRIVAGTRVLSAITALPAFFVDVPAWLKLVVAVLVVLTVVCVVLVLSPARQPATVTD
jgi:hypothetical protein